MGVAILTDASPLTAAGIKSLDRIEQNLLRREIMERSHSFVGSSAALEELLDDFSHFLKFSERPQLRVAIRDLEQVEELHRKLVRDADSLRDYLAENGKSLRQEGLGHLLELRELTDNGFRRFNEALGDYIAARQELLHWTEEHFGEIVAGNAAAVRQYDKLYKRCEQVMEKEYDRYLDRIQFVNVFRQDHPELAEYLAK
ncbi:MAG TPA: hypothetical protein VIU40_04590 [Geobacteraceae bacterium]